MLKVYADYDAIAKAGKLNELTIPELVKFLNDQKTVLTAEQSQNVTTTLNKAVENSNKAACDNKCAEFCAMERSEMWRSYAPNPYYMGIKITTDPKSGATIRRTRWNHATTSSGRPTVPGGSRVPQDTCIIAY